MSQPCIKCGIDNDLHCEDDDHEPWTAAQEITALRLQVEKLCNKIDIFKKALEFIAYGNHRCKPCYGCSAECCPVALDALGKDE